jgi:hypothetical protein
MKRLGEAGKLLRNVPKAGVLVVLDHLAQAYREDQVTKREVARIEAAKEILIADIRQRYALYHEIFNQLFAERREVMNKHFEIINLGIEQDKRDLVLAGLKGLNHLVSTSPFADAVNLSRMLENGMKIEL